jgi:hypothetical protein
VARCVGQSFDAHSSGSARSTACQRAAAGLALGADRRHACLRRFFAKAGTLRLPTFQAHHAHTADARYSLIDGGCRGGGLRRAPGDDRARSGAAATADAMQSLAAEMVERGPGGGTLEVSSA